MAGYLQTKPYQRIAIVEPVDCTFGTLKLDFADSSGWKWLDDVPIYFGTDCDWSIEFDSGTNGNLEISELLGTANTQLTINNQVTINDTTNTGFGYLLNVTKLDYDLGSTSAYGGAFNIKIVGAGAKFFYAINMAQTFAAVGGTTSLNSAAGYFLQNTTTTQTHSAEILGFHVQMQDTNTVTVLNDYYGVKLHFVPGTASVRTLKRYAGIYCNNIRTAYNIIGTDGTIEDSLIGVHVEGWPVLSTSPDVGQKVTGAIGILLGAQTAAGSGGATGQAVSNPYNYGIFQQGATMWGFRNEVEPLTSTFIGIGSEDGSHLDVYSELYFDVNIGGAESARFSTYGQQFANNPQSSNYTVAQGDDVILCDASGGAFTVTLPPATDADANIFRIKKTDSSSNAVTIQGDGGAENIDGQSSVDLASQYDSLTVYSDSSEWHIV